MKRFNRGQDKAPPYQDLTQSNASRETTVICALTTPIHQ